MELIEHTCKGGLAGGTLQEFILESNKGKLVNFVPDMSKAIEVLHG